MADDERANGSPPPARGWGELSEAEWLGAVNLFSATTFLRRRGEHRRLRLFACACCRRVWELLRFDAAKRIVDLAEAYADGEVTEADLRAAYVHSEFDVVPAQERGHAEPGTQLSRRTLDAILAARLLADTYYERSDGASIVAQDTSLDPAADFFPMAGESPVRSVPPDEGEIAEQEKLLRDIFGNPFRPVTFDSTWRTPDACKLADLMYRSRDFSPMPILADALQDAGCDDEEILGHCLGEGPHVRGCWVVDLVLGKT